MGAFSEFFKRLQPYKPTREIYILMHSCTTQMIANTPIKANMASILESNILFTAVCKWHLDGYEELSAEVLSPLYGELLIHLARDGYLNLGLEDLAKFLEGRLQLYAREIDQIFAEESTYYGGVLTYLLYEKPLSSEVRASHDLGKYIQFYPFLIEGSDAIREYLDNKYGL